jgi:hypothetical protein
MRNVILMKEADYRSAFGDVPSSIHINGAGSECNQEYADEEMAVPEYIKTVEEDLAQQKSITSP